MGNSYLHRSPRGRIQNSLILALLILLSLTAGVSDAAEGNSARLIRIAVRPHVEYTRLSFFLDNPAQYSFSALPDGNISITFRSTGGSLFRKLRSRSDRFVGGIKVSPRGQDLRIRVRAKEGCSVLPVWVPDANLLTVKVAPATAAMVPVVGDRQAIWNGAGKLVRDFDPPFKPIFPFLPTDRRELLSVVAESDAKLFMLGESALYKGKSAQAEDLFAVFATRESPVRPLANYRLGEALYILQKYDGALKAFRTAEQLWPEYLAINPGAAFYYADSIVRSGDFTGGRKSLGRLIASLADRKYAPLLLVRLADTLARQRHEMEALAIYRTVAANFPNDKAGSYAALKLADRRIFSLQGGDYRQLCQEYQTLVDKGDAQIREEAFFKIALLESLYGPAPTALPLVIQYERKYSRGLFINIARGMREELLAIVSRDLYAGKDFTAFVSLIQDNQNYLSRCFADLHFVDWVDEAFTSRGLLKKEIGLFGALLDKEWAASSVPSMLRAIMEHAITLADFPLAETSGRNFINKFPRHDGVWSVREKLGRICFLKNDMPAAAAELEWLSRGDRRAKYHESHYYLGKALVERQKLGPAEKAFATFISLVKDQSPRSVFVTDAYYQYAGVKLAAGDRAAATAGYRAGLDAAGPEEKDQFLYKLGELALLEGRGDEARAYWEKVTKEGTDAVWQKLAAQSLSDLAWKEQYKRMSK